MKRSEMLGWVLGSVLGLLITGAGIILVMETMVLTYDENGPRTDLEQTSDRSK